MNDQRYPELQSIDVHDEKFLINPEKDNQILNKLDHVELQLNSLNSLFEQRLTYDQDKEKAFDLLYTELQSLKKESAFNNIKPLYIDLILLLDRVENIKVNITDEKFSSYSDAIKSILESLVEEVLEILSRQEIEVIQTYAGMIFDPSQQKAIKTKETSIELENNKVFSIIRRGFRYGNRILRPEEVIVFKYHQI